jgi:hypothetical protein
MLRLLLGSSTLRNQVSALFALSAFVACSEDAVSIYKRQLQSQQEAVDKLKALGGNAEKKQYPLGEGWVVKLSGVTLTDEVFGHLKLLERIAELDLSQSNFEDAMVPRLLEVGGVLFKLNLSKTAITDAGVTPLADLVLLAEVDLTGTKVTQGAVKQLNAKRRNDPKIMQHFKTTKVKL